MKQVEAREDALGALYAADSRGLDEIDFTKISKRAAVLAEGTWESRAAIDKAITAASTRWRIERMPLVDRNILRLGVYELSTDTLPIAVVISQAVELAKKFSTAKSSAFVNGVLSAVAASDFDLTTEPEPESEPDPEPEPKPTPTPESPVDEESNVDSDPATNSEPDETPA